MRDKIIETINKMNDAEIVQLYEHIFGTGTAQDAKIDADAKMLEKKFGVKTMQEMCAICIGTGVGIDTLADFVKYRNEIKKPIRTARPLKAFAQKLIEAQNKGYKIKEIIDIMYTNEWQTFELSWIDKKISKKAIATDLSEFGFK